jgi:hypothetical protein
LSNDLSTLVRNANPVPTTDHLSAGEFNAALAAIEASLKEHPKRRRATTLFQRLRQKPAIAFVAAMAIVALVVALPMFLFATREGEVTEPTTVTSTLAPTTTVVTTTAAPTTTNAPTTTAPTTTVPEVVVPPPPEISWARMPDQPAFDGADIGQWRAALVPGGPGLVGVGHVVGETENLHAAVFTSSDAETWDRIDEPFKSAEDAKWIALSDVAVHSAGRLVIGGGTRSDAAAWVSDDGYSWETVSSEAFGGFDLQNILGVVAGGPGFVAVGDDGSNAGVWVSRDGFEWTKIEDEDLLAGDDINVSMYDVQVAGPGLVAVGSAGLFDGAGVTGAVWLSPDGYQWERLPRDTFDAESGDTGFQNMTVHPATGRIIAWGGEMWTSSDGTHWIPTERGASLDGPPANAQTAWNGATGVAAGMDWAFSLWVSGDSGTNWSRVEPVEPMFDDFADQAEAVAWFDDRWVVIGNGVIWIGTPEG